MSIDYKNFPEPKLDPVVNPRPKGGPGRPVIVAARRTAIGKFQGSLSEIPAPELGAAVVRQMLQDTGLASELIDEVIFGCVLAAGQGQNPTRQVLIKSGMDPRAAALTINQVCASGLKSVELASRAIRAGDARAVLAGGMENMSRAPYLLEKARGGYRLGHGQMLDSMISDGLWDPYSDFHMGNTGELVAQKYHLSREQQDEYAYNSHQKALAAAAAGKFKDEIVPVQVPAGKGKFHTFEVDECPRADTSREALAKLRPAFVKEGGTVTAGNAPGVNDAAAALLVMDEDFAREQGLKPLARLLDSYAGGLEPAWVMLTPIPSVRGLLKRNPEWKLEDFACVEINEAFSVQALAVIRELGLDPARVNVNGGAVALGHPIGCSGARILVTLIHALRQRGGGRGLATLCLGGGNGLALAIETV
ncbi:MAG: thiolase family protein [Candidatus Eremiobacteraeota bacterium]|nr:thiolase family protein [Candidatus Eremiobacteraeota bacterium]